MDKHHLAAGLIQVAGVIDDREARMLCHCGVRYLGIPLRLPVHSEDLSENDAANIVGTLPPDCHGVLITYLDDAAEIAKLTDELGTSIVQLHGPISRHQLKLLHTARPRLTIIKSLVIGAADTQPVLETVEALSDLVDAFITDTFDPDTGASGATGRTHDWAVSREIVARSKQPVILAGGLTPDNIGRAIELVRPAGVDVHTGVEDESGRKDERLVRAFIAAASSAFAEISSSQAVNR